MKTLVATALVVHALFSAAAGAQAASPQYDNYPEWAQKAFDPQG
jgi:hypothetical protein